MSTWHTSSPPKAELTLETDEEVVPETGNRVTIFRTKNGVRFARVVEPGGFVIWLQEVP